MLAGGGPNSLTVSNVETVSGGSGDDAVALGTAAAAGSVVDLGGGEDRLLQSSAGSNS